jgi:hypothetical protein
MAARYITYQGIMYRLAADAADPATILETGPNPTVDIPAPEVETSATPSPSPSDEDLKTLEMLSSNVTSKATSLAATLAPLVSKVKAKAKVDADNILMMAKGSIDSLVEDFKLLASKYKGVANRSMNEPAVEPKK